MRCAGFTTGTELHMLDHMAPLAELMHMPLITTEELTYQIARHYYPQIEVRYMPDLEFKHGEIAEQFDVLFECKHWGPNVKPLYMHFYKKEMQLVYCPHGQSDKGYKYPSLAQCALQDLVLVYGNLYLQMMQELNIPLKNQALVGNYRLAFYQRYQSFYDAIAEAEIFSRLKPASRTLLYAPTWKDKDSSTSFFHLGPMVIDQLPSDWNLIIKLHPTLEREHPAEFHATLALAETNPNIVIVNQFPPVYPILTRSDIYLGDFSSVGYDYLFFQRPLFFLPTHNSGRLHSCGQTLDLNKNLFLQMEQPNSFQQQQAKLYRFAFENVQSIKRNIDRALKKD